MNGNDISSIKFVKVEAPRLEDEVEQVIAIKASPPKLTSAELNNNTLTIEFDSIINNTKLPKKRFKVRANGKKMNIKSVAIDTNNETLVHIALQPN